MLSVNYISITLENPNKQTKKTPWGPVSKYHLEEPGRPQGGGQGQTPGLEGRAEALQADPAWGPSAGLFPSADSSASSTSSVQRGCSQNTVWPTMCKCHPPLHSLGQAGGKARGSRFLGRNGGVQSTYLGRWCSDLSRRRRSPQRNWACVSGTALTGGCHHTRPRGPEAGRERWSISSAHFQATFLPWPSSLTGLASRKSPGRGAQGSLTPSWFCARMRPHSVPLPMPWPPTGSRTRNWVKSA